MFKSQYSGKQYPSGTKPVRIVVATRPKKYYNRVGEDVRISHGTEIVKELVIGPDEIEQVKKEYRHAR